MIRRRVELSGGGQFFRLISQDDHARLAGELAAVWGNDLFTRPRRQEQVVLATKLHDSGWPLHDEAPQLNEAGLPSDVFETPVERSVTVWEAGAARAEAADPYAGLLVSIHVHRLSRFADREPAKLTNRQRFLLIRFRNDQAQRQLRLRQGLGMLTDHPLDHGLPLEADRAARSDAAEQELAHDVALLQACDVLSLCICCTEPPTRSVGPVLRQPGGPVSMLRVDQPGPAELRVRPWPLGVRSVQVSVPYRQVAARAYRDAGELAEAVASTERGRLEARLAG